MGVAVGLVKGSQHGFVSGVRVGSCGTVEPLVASPPIHSCAFEVPAAALVDRRTALVALRVRQTLDDGMGKPFSVRRLGHGVYRLGALEEGRERATDDDALNRLRLDVPPVIQLCLALLTRIPS